MDKTVEYLKQRWWLLLTVAVVAVLLLIPTKTGLPGNDYEGCDNTDPRYTSTCITTEVKGVAKEANGGTSFTVPITTTEGTDDVTFHLKGDRGLKIGDTIFMNIAEWDKKVYLFINTDSNLFFTLLSHIFSASQGSTTKINLDTLKEI